MGNIAFGYPAGTTPRPRRYIICVNKALTAIIGTTLSQPGFLQYMGLLNKHGLTANANALIGAMNGVFQVWLPTLKSCLEAVRLTRIRLARSLGFGPLLSSWTNGAGRRQLLMLPLCQ
jgi:hypothetical protein